MTENIGKGIQFLLDNSHFNYFVRYYINNSFELICTHENIFKLRKKQYALNEESMIFMLVNVYYILEQTIDSHFKSVLCNKFRSRILNIFPILDVYAYLLKNHFVIEQNQLSTEEIRKNI